MDKDTRNAIERATQKARKLLEEDFAAQLEGDFDVHADGDIGATAGRHLSPRDAYRRDRILAAIEHKCAAGMTAADAVRDYLRDAAFTTLNRFVALKMLESRELVQECIAKGEQSAGFCEFFGMAPGLPLLPENEGYRIYIESLFDELSTEVKVLFDRRDPASVLWPKRTTFEQFFGILNDAELDRVWGEDETLGWVYQFFNGEDERRKMREESQSPRNSRELAVRNQFFTPRYVVQFLTDNTLGRIWFEMRSAKTALAERCVYMARRIDEEIPTRARKDPRDLRVLDPACGSGHFLLYAFDLLLLIYEEAYADPESPRSEATGRTLAEDYTSIDGLRRAMPGLVLAHNLHGVDIDSRCAQIAQLALWLRAQKAYRELGVKRAERAQIRRSNIVVAEPLVADNQIAKEFVAKLGNVQLERVFVDLVESLALAGDLGLLLRLEQIVKRPGNQGELFELPESRIRAALGAFMLESESGSNAKRRLFADDTAHGLGLLELSELRFDVVLMNPPFGKVPKRSETYLRKHYEGCWTDVYGAFLFRFLSRRERPWVGAITSSLFLYTKQMRNLRSLWIEQGSLELLVELGPQVLDGATVETALTVSSDRNSLSAGFLDATDIGREQLESQLREAAFRRIPLQRFRQLPLAPLCYHVSDAVLGLFEISAPIDPSICTVAVGNNTFDDFRFVRLRWEVCPDAIGDVWFPYEIGGEYQAFIAPSVALYRWGREGREARAFQIGSFGTDAQVRQSSKWWFAPGITYPRVSSIAFGPRWMPSGHIFSGDSISVFPNEAQSMPSLLGHLLSSWAEEVTQIYGRYRKIEARAVAALPFTESVLADGGERIGALARAGIREVALMETFVETSPLFCGSPKYEKSCEEWSVPTLAAICAELDQLVAQSLFAEGTAPAMTVPARKDLVERFACVAGVRMAARIEGRISVALGQAFGRWGSESGRANERDVAVSSLLSEMRLPPVPPAASLHATRDVLVDDLGHGDDIVAHICRQFDGDQDVLRELVRDKLFAFHLTQYSRAGRRAPIYWQLASASARYSVWLYVHGFGKDTLFRVQNDFVAPKLAHEERCLESLANDLRNGATAAQRKQLSAQESFVEELRVFLDEVKRVAPLWNPNLDDGVVINFAPLWRLVPQNRDWQKELKTTWDALADGKYDWAHLAMHLWPERVVPKCVKDRSLAIAHGLEDLFWVEGTDGKWAARKTPTKSVDELVKERLSPAVKSALESLLDAPVASGQNPGRRGGSRRRGNTAFQIGGA
jgi:hypothetical protein